MKYRLKDKELQKKLDEISGGDFTRKLEENAKAYEREFEYYGGGATVRFQLGNNALNSERLHVFLNIDDVELVKEYDPHAWNEYPEVTPPEGVLMRLEFDDRFFTAGRYHAARKEWRDSNWKAFPVTANVKRFRPWED